MEYVCYVNNEAGIDQQLGEMSMTNVGVVSESCKSFLAFVGFILGRVSNDLSVVCYWAVVVNHPRKRSIFIK